MPADSLDVLVIEDDPDTCANLRDILELDDHRVESAGTAAEALRRDDWPRFGVIILDWRLPDADAEMLLPRLRELAPEAAIIIATGTMGLGGAVLAMQHGAADYIVKPIDPDALRGSLARIAERRRLVAARRQAEDQLRLLAAAVRGVAEGVCITDAQLDLPGPRIMFVNDAMTRITGYTADELLGRTPRVFQGRKTDGITTGRLKQSLMERRPFRCELINYRKDGTEYAAELDISPITDESERVIAYVAIHRDISDRKEAEARLLQSERLAAIGQMVAGLAHESRNALQRSQACLEMLSRRVKDRPEAMELINRLHKAQDHLHHLYEEVRGYAAPLKLNLQPTHLGEVVNETWEHLAITRQGRQASLTQHADGVNLRALVDRHALDQVFRNVLENALGACSDPVVVQVTWSERRLDGQPALQAAVRDNGPGMTPEVRQRIFDPFYTTKTQGTGLGMAIAKRIVEAHRGRIEVTETSPGAEIVITLPKGAPT